MRLTLSSRVLARAQYSKQVRQTYQLPRRHARRLLKRPANSQVVRNSAPSTGNTSNNYPRVSMDTVRLGASTAPAADRETPLAIQRRVTETACAGALAIPGVTGWISASGRLPHDWHSQRSGALAISCDRRYHLHICGSKQNFGQPKWPSARPVRRLRQRALRRPFRAAGWRRIHGPEPAPRRAG